MDIKKYVKVDAKQKKGNSIEREVEGILRQDLKTAELQYAQGNFEQALASFYTIYRQSWNYRTVPEVSYGVAKCLVKLKRHQDAIRYLNVARYYNPHFAPSYLLSTKVYLYLKQWPLSLDILDVGLDNVPKEDSLYRELLQMKSMVHTKLKGKNIDTKQRVARFKNQQMDIINVLPAEIVHGIFQYIGKKDTLFACQVSKSWYRYFSKCPIVWDTLAFKSSRVGDMSSLDRFCQRFKDPWCKRLDLQTDNSHVQQSALKILKKTGIRSAVEIKLNLTSGCLPLLNEWILQADFMSRLKTIFLRSDQGNLQDWVTVFKCRSLENFSVVLQQYNVSKNVMKSLADLADLQQLRKFELISPGSRITAGQLSPIIEFISRKMKKLEHLSFAVQGEEFRLPQVIQSLPRLKSLMWHQRIDHRSFTNLVIDSLLSLKTLECLDVGGWFNDRHVEVQQEQTQRLMQLMSRLFTLRLAHCDYLFLRCFDTLPSNYLTRLQYFSIDGCVNVRANIIVNLVLCSPGLIALSIKDQPDVEDGHLKSIVNAAPYLNSITLSRLPQVTSIGAYYLTKLEYVKSVKLIQCDRVTSAAIKDLSTFFTNNLGASFESKFTVA
ncbi:hypothetical protein MP228_001701 [Amoeboaphelidium protococcarum]|nr:hypothetical protein MP228_001701 [Amoeboaphelidium protococcarum]